MQYLFIFLLFNLFTYCLNITDNNSESFLKNNRTLRCLKSTKNNVKNRGKFSKKLNFLSYTNVSASDSDISESSQNFLFKGLLIDENVPITHWHEYKANHKKCYTTQHQEMAALRKWQNNLKRVAEHNRLFLQGKQSYSLNLNHFGDLSVKDYFKNILKLFTSLPLFDPFEDHRRTAFKKSLKSDIPTKFDWRDRGFKPRLEEQWQCGACYAFAVTHALQAQLYKAHRVWTELSPQQIIDCSYGDGNMGCGGGSLRGALRYVAREGLIAEDHYPYKGKQRHCKYNSLLVSARPRRWATLPAGDEAAIERAVATIGPVAVAVNAAPFTFQLYRSGIYDDPFCSSWVMNHAMLLVGYTPEYWLLLNWWGRQWGEGGYMRIKRGFNVCGVANMATYVEL